MSERRALHSIIKMGGGSGGMIVQLHIMVHALKEALTTFLSCDLLLVYCLDITEDSIGKCLLF